MKKKGWDSNRSRRKMSEAGRNVTTISKANTNSMPQRLTLTTVFDDFIIFK